MSFNPPSPIVPFLPPKHVTPKIHLKLTMPLHPNRSIHVVLLSRNINPAERVRKPHAIVREKHATRRELVSEPDRVVGRDPLEQSVSFVVSATIWVFVEFPKVVEVKSGAEAVPSWEPPVGVRKTCRAYRELR